MTELRESFPLTQGSLILGECVWNNWLVATHLSNFAGQPRARGTPFTKGRWGDGCSLIFIPTRTKRRKGPRGRGGSRAQVFPAPGRGRRRGARSDPGRRSGRAEPAGKSRAPDPGAGGYPGATRALRCRAGGSGGSPRGGTGRCELRRGALPAGGHRPSGGRGREAILRRVPPVPPGKGGRGSSPTPAAGPTPATPPVPSRGTRGGPGCGAGVTAARSAGPRWPGGTERYLRCRRRGPAGSPRPLPLRWRRAGRPGTAARRPRACARPSRARLTVPAADAGGLRSPRPEPGGARPAASAPRPGPGTTGRAAAGAAPGQARTAAGAAAAQGRFGRGAAAAAPAAGRRAGEGAGGAMGPAPGGEMPEKPA